MTKRRIAAAVGAVAVVAAGAVVVGQPAGAKPGQGWFQRVDTMPVYANSDAAEETAAEIAAVTPDGDTVIYTDSPGEQVGFAGIDRHARLSPRGLLAVGGEPTSVDVLGELALVAVNTSESYTEPSGKLVVVDIAEHKILAEHELGGQPDSVDISPDGRYAAIAIENERDEDAGDGGLPQPPAGYLSVVDIQGAPSGWTLRAVELTGVAEVSPQDPEPEYVAINEHNQVAVTMQENNHIAVIDLASGEVRADFSAGETTVDGVDTVTDGTIDPSGSVTAAREPDSVAWLDEHTIATADEGDWHGGSRTWTAFDARSGEVVYSSGAELEQLAINQGQYPEKRAGKKGVEPEGLAVATYGRHKYAFVGLERANLVAVYDVTMPRKPRLVQGLPTGVGPEGLLPVPQRNLLVVAAEEDSADDAVRSSLATYRLTNASLSGQLRRNAAAPSIVSDGLGFGALSGLSALPGDDAHVVAVGDNAYRPSALLRVDVGKLPAVVESSQVITKDGQPAVYDLEGVAATKDGYWLVSEGNADTTENLLIRTYLDGVVQEEIRLPEPVAAGAIRFGFEGVAVVGEHVWVAVQRGWADNEPEQTTLARYTPATGDWAFAAYPLDKASAGWVGLSELTSTSGGTLLVVERDNQRGETAAVKRVYRVDVSTVDPAAAGRPKPLLAKRPVLDLLPALSAGGAAVHDKIEGLALVGGRLVGAVDNDGVDDAPGESVLLRLGTH